jgi:hypothetical protein
MMNLVAPEQPLRVVPGDQLTLQVKLDLPGQLIGVACQLESSAAGAFELVGRTAEPPLRLWGALTGPIEPVSARFFWGVVTYPEHFGPGVVTLGTLTLAVKPEAPLGSYELKLANGEGYLHPATPAFVRLSTGDSVLVQVVPEPGNFAAMVLFFGLAFRSRRRRAFYLAKRGKEHRIRA